MFAGKLTESPISKVHGLAEWLGPVTAPSLRLASRIANTLRGGHPVADYSEFGTCELVLVSVPDGMVAQIVGELVESTVNWTSTSVVLCSNQLGSEVLAPLEMLGCAVGSLAVIPGFEDHWFLLECERPLERKIHALIARRGVRITVIERLLKGQYVAAIASLSTDLIPQVKQAADALKQAGMSNADAAAILEKQATRTIRSYFRSGKT